MNGERWVHWKGRTMAASRARVSVMDAGFLYGDGIYETMRVYAGRVFALDRHLARLARSAEGVGLTLPDPQELNRAIRETIEANAEPEAVARLTVTRGTLGRRLDLSSAGAPSVLVTQDPVDPGADEARRRGSRVVFSRYLRSAAYPLSGIKSTNYQISLFARNEAREAGALEALVPDESGDIVEAAAANVFLVEDGHVVTPPIGTGILGGITREVVLELCAVRGTPVEQATLSRERIARCTELFLSGTTIQVAPIVQVESAPVGDGTPGPLTLALLEDYLAMVRADCAP